MNKIHLCVMLYLLSDGWRARHDAHAYLALINAGIKHTKSASKRVRVYACVPLCVYACVSGVCLRVWNASHIFGGQKGRYCIIAKSLKKIKIFNLSI